MITALALFAAAYASEINIEGWKIRLGDGVTQDSSWNSAKLELTRQLQQISRVVADGPQTRLKEVVIWININSEITPCMAYHPSVEWLKEHKANTEMAGCVELGSCKNFVSWTYEQPWMVMHELAHAYHHQNLKSGFENKDVIDTYNTSLKSKSYESVLHWDGQRSKHYAMNNPMEFFAETTESYFGTNDFYPFVRAELLTFDKGAYELMRKTWGEPVKRTN
ncbi:MAG: hypothetical protein JST40_08960 [Armatimonadetes bacterium]|nr:hypothetical protein [Armatimonadota bacterium]